MLPGGIGLPTVPADLYNTVLHDPKARDPRGFIISADQPDFATATKFINTLEKNGIEVEKASSQFQVAGKTYPAGSFIVKTAQAGRPFVMDMFQPQDHPNDFRYPGGPPIPPYDTAGWTLAYQMGVQFDRVYDGFDGPFARVTGLQPMPVDSVEGPANPAGYLISHQVNNAVILTNRLLKANCRSLLAQVRRRGRWTANGPGRDLGSRFFHVHAHRAAGREGTRRSRTLAVAAKPAGDAYKIKPVRIALYDQYGGNMPSGWDRWLFEQFEFPDVTVVYPKTLDAGDLKSKFDVIVFTDGAYRAPANPACGAGGGRGGGGFFGNQIKDDQIPEEWRSHMGRITADETIPQIKKFVEAGGAVITIGSSTAMAS